MKFIVAWINKIIKNLLCLLGHHSWCYNEEHNKRWCRHCGKSEEYWCNIYWCECIDGEPLF